MMPGEIRRPNVFDFHECYGNGIADSKCSRGAGSGRKIQRTGFGGEPCR